MSKAQVIWIMVERLSQIDINDLTRKEIDQIKKDIRRMVPDISDHDLDECFQEAEMRVAYP